MLKSLVRTFILAILALPSFGDEKATSGFVADKPAEGVSVTVEGGFLVPYQRRIPGTEVTFEMVPIPGGTFAIGDEQVAIKVEPMWVGKFEVTWAEYKQYMALNSAFDKFAEQGIREVTDENKVDAITAPSKLYDPSFTFAAGEDPRQPAVAMSQYAAKQYTKWLSLLTEESYRLPSEAEWEYACRAGTETQYSFGDDPERLGDYGWFADNGEDATHFVGEKKPNAWGLHDMHGNVAEWTLDAFDEAWFKQLSERPAPISCQEAIHWPTKLFPRVLRGGSWGDVAEDCSSSSRKPSNDEDWRSYDPNTPKSPWWFASDESQGIGFRIVRPWKAIRQEEQQKYWDADLPAIQRVADYRIDKEGRGERGIVDPELPAAIEKLNNDAP